MRPCGFIENNLYIFVFWLHCCPAFNRNRCWLCGKEAGMLNKHTTAGGLSMCSTDKVGEVASDKSIPLFAFQGSADYWGCYWMEPSGKRDVFWIDAMRCQLSEYQAWPSSPDRVWYVVAAIEWIRVSCSIACCMVVSHISVQSLPCQGQTDPDRRHW